MTEPDPQPQQTPHQTRCGAVWPLGGGDYCTELAGHEGPHKSPSSQWPNKTAQPHQTREDVIRAALAELGTATPQYAPPKWAESWAKGTCCCGARLVNVECYCGGHVACSRSGWSVGSCNKAPNAGSGAAS